MKKKILLAVLFVMPFGITLAQNAPKDNAMQSFGVANTTTTQQMTPTTTEKMQNNATTATYSNVGAEIRSAYEAIKYAIWNIRDTAALQLAAEKTKRAARAITEYLVGKTNNTAVKSYDATRLSNEPKQQQTLPSNQPVNASK